MKLVFSKCISACCIIVLSCGVFLTNLQPAKAIKEFKVDVVPRRTGSIAKYQFHFSIEKKIEVHQWFHIVFPIGTKLTPPLPEEEHERTLQLKEIAESINLSLPPCNACMGLPLIRFEPDGSLTLMFNTHLELDPQKEGYRDITITIMEKAGFTNPIQQGMYEFRISNQQEPHYVSSLPVEIVESKISTPKISIQNPIFNQTSAYDIEFETGPAGILNLRTSTIFLEFPPGTIIPTPSNDTVCQMISINDIPVMHPQIIEGRKLIISAPRKFLDAEKLQIHIDRKWGIKNPLTPGLYKLIAYTSTDLDPGESTPYEIIKGPNQANLEVNPAKTGKLAEFKLSYIAETDSTESMESIQILFPDIIDFPAHIDKQTVAIQGKSVDDLQIQDHLVILKTKTAFKKGEGVEVKFSKEAGIQTPKTPCQIGIVIKLISTGTDLISNLVDIESQKLEINEIKISPPNANDKAVYELSLTFGEHYIPSIGEVIQVQFSFMDKPIQYTVTEDLTQEFLVKLEGIQNPTAGNYSVSVSTTIEPDFTRQSFRIIPPRPTTMVMFEGGTKGKNDWYIFSPLVSFSCSDTDSSIFYYFDDPKNQLMQYNGNPSALDPGQYIARLFYYAINSFGKEDLKKIDIKMDYVDPEITITNPKVRKIETNNKTLKIEGVVSKTKTTVYGVGRIEVDKNLTIQGKPIGVKEDGLFSIEIELQEGLNQIPIHLEDEAGRYVEHVYSVVLDSTPPEINILSPLPNATFIKNPVEIIGKTDPSALMVINGNVTRTEEDGTFHFNISLINIGQTTIYFMATDPIGNESKKEIQLWFGYTIQLQIGNRKATTNGVEKLVPLAPFIQNSRTLVPFRFIGEELHAVIDFMVDPRTRQVKTVSYELKDIKILLTIGSKKAIVYGKEIELEVPAQIIKGSTVVPLRFVTEGLNCRLNWDPETQRITIWFPKFNI